MKSNLFTAGSQFVSCDRVGKNIRTAVPPCSVRAHARLLAKETQDLTVLAVSGGGGGEAAAGEG